MEEAGFGSYNQQAPTEDNDPLGMSLLTQALQPDKIFDLPLALVKV